MQSLHHLGSCARCIKGNNNLRRVGCAGPLFCPPCHAVELAAHNARVATRKASR